MLEFRYSLIRVMSTSSGDRLLITYRILSFDSDGRCYYVSKKVWCSTSLSETEGIACLSYINAAIVRGSGKFSKFANALTFPFLILT